jgi:hypothetical protein
MGFFSSLDKRINGNRTGWRQDQRVEFNFTKTRAVVQYTVLHR